MYKRMIIYIVLNKKSSCSSQNRDLKCVTNSKRGGDVNHVLISHKGH